MHLSAQLSASGAARSAVADQQIGDDVVTRHRRLAGKRRAGTAALDHVVDSYTVPCFGLDGLIGLGHGLGIERSASSIWPRLTPPVSIHLSETVTHVGLYVSGRRAWSIVSGRVTVESVDNPILRLMRKTHNI